MRNPIASFWRNRRITVMVTVTMVTLVFFSITVITMLDVSRQRSIFEQQLEEKGLALARTLNDVLANSLYFRDMQKLRHLADVAKAQPEIQSLTLFAPDGRILIGPGDEKFPVGSVSDEVVERVLAHPQADIRFMPEYVEVLTPIIVSGDVIGGVRFHFDNSMLASEIRSTINQHIWQGALVMLVGIVLSYLFAQSIVRPVRELVRVTNRISVGDFDVSVEENRADEIGDLARSLKTMTRRLQEAERRRAELQNVQLREANLQLKEEVSQRKRAQLVSEQSSKKLESTLNELRETQQKMLQQERLSAVGQISSGIAHDINNRLQIILGLSDRLLVEPSTRLDDEDARNKLKSIRVSVQEAGDVVNLLRDFYRPQKGFEKFEEVDLAELVNAAVQLTEPSWKDQAQSRGVHLCVRTEIADIPLFAGSPTELREALINLIFNAIDALPAGGDITVRARIESDDVVVEVSDDGVGMSEEVRRRCLEPFFTTKGDGGTGLGLAMIYGTVQRHDGKIEIDSSVGTGTTMRLRLPRHQLPAVGPVPEKSVPPTGPLDILVTDDEPMVQKLLAALLKRDGHRVVTASDGRDGLKKFRGQRFDVVILDRAMPGMNGDDLALNIKDLAPQVPVIMVTGFGGLMNATEEVPKGVDLVLGKPISHADLTAAIAQVLKDKAAGNVCGEEPALG